MTREEAIEVYHGLINTKVKEAFEFFAPELAESEDERMRKKLCEFIHDTLGDELDSWGMPKQEVLAWLEKQKEQKPVVWSEEDEEMYINVASSLRGYACGLENEEHKKHIKKGLNWLKSLRGRFEKED